MSSWLDAVAPPYKSLTSLHAAWLAADDRERFLSHELTLCARRLAEKHCGRPFVGIGEEDPQAPCEVTVLLTTTGTSAYSWTTREIEIGLASLADLPAGSVQWLAGLMSHFWHELGHDLYSTHELADDTEALLAAGALLEDLRIERRLLGDEPAARAWLRLNLARSWPDSAVVAGSGGELGWAPALSMSAGRVAAGVISAEECERLLEALPPQARACAEDLAGAWATFAGLPDDEVDDDDGRTACETLANRLSAQVIPAILGPSAVAAENGGDDPPTV